MISYDRPWSDIGIDVSDAINVKQALVDADLDFHVEVVPGLFKYKSTKTADSYYYIIRTDTEEVLGQCKGIFTPLQNSVLVDIAQPFIDSGAAKLDTIGNFDNGARVWILLKLSSHSIAVTEADTLDHYLLLLNGHDAKTAVQIGIIPFRLVCSNMLPRIGRHMEKFKHTENAEEMIQFFRIQIASKLEHVQDDCKVYKRMAATACSEKDFDEYARKVMGYGRELSTRAFNILERLHTLFCYGRGNAGKTYYDAFNAITEYLNYEVGQKQETRINSLWFGDGNKKSIVAFELAKENCE